jgi:hypothetical protein
VSTVKKIIFGLFVAAAAGLGLWAYLQVKNSKKPGVEALSLMPDSCLIYLHSGNFFELNKKLNSQSLIADRLRLIKDVALLCNALKGFDSLFNSNVLLEEQIRDNPVHLGLYPGMKWLAAFNIKRLGNQQQISDEISRIFHARDAGQGIFESRFSGQALYFELSAGVALMSDSREMILEARNGVRPKLQQNKAFKNFEQTLEEDAPLSVYINHEVYLKSGAPARLNLCAVVETGFSAGVVDIQPSEVKVNGYLTPGGGDLISALIEQHPQNNDFTRFLPVHTAAFRAYGISSYPGLKTRLGKRADTLVAAFWKPVNDTALYNLEEEFYLNISGYLVDFETAAPGQNFIALQIADSIMASEHLLAMSDSVLRNGNDTLYRLHRWQPGSLKLFEPLSPYPTHYAARKGSCLYFAEDAASLAQLLQTLRGGEWMDSDESFSAYKNQNFYETFNYLVYCAPNLARERIRQFFNFDVSGSKDPFENFRHFSFSLERQGKQFKFRWQLVHETEKTNKDRSVLWSLKLDTTCSVKAAGFLNHSTGENELLLQDDDHTLYLVNAKGVVLWKKPLAEKIRSEVFMVDAFRNNKYQALFSSRNYLHLIDRNGNYLPGYPVKLPAEATCGLSVFDYDQTQDYRLFIACKNHMIYNYSLTGTRQAGFTPVRTDYEVSLPVQYVKVGLSDYLVTIDREGQIYTFSRKGEGRIGLKNKAVAGCSDFYIDASANINTTYLVYVDDKNNSLNKISFTDKKELIKMDNAVEGADIIFGHANADKTMDVIFTRPGSVLAYDLNGNLLVNKPLDRDLGKTGIYTDESGTIFFAFSAIRQELNLFSQPPRKAAPFKASALPFTSRLFNDHKTYMVIPAGSRLNCMVLN